MDGLLDGVLKLSRINLEKGLRENSPRDDCPLPSGVVGGELFGPSRTSCKQPSSLAFRNPVKASLRVGRLVEAPWGLNPRPSPMTIGRRPEMVMGRQLRLTAPHPI